jgi:hypothetical protein
MRGEVCCTMRFDSAFQHSLAGQALKHKALSHEKIPRMGYGHRHGQAYIYIYIYVCVEPHIFPRLAVSCTVALNTANQVSLSAGLTCFQKVNQPFRLPQLPPVTEPLVPPRKRDVLSDLGICYCTIRSFRPTLHSSTYLTYS